jgi:hypothetical protein
MRKLLSLILLSISISTLHGAAEKSPAADFYPAAFNRQVRTIIHHHILPTHIFWIPDNTTLPLETLGSVADFISSDGTKKSLLFSDEQHTETCTDYVLSPNERYLAVKPRVSVDFKGIHIACPGASSVMIYDLVTHIIIPTHFTRNALSLVWHPKDPVLFLAIKATVEDQHMIKIHRFDALKRSRETPCDVIHTTADLISAAISPDLTEIALGLRNGKTGDAHIEVHQLYPKIAG